MRYLLDTPALRTLSEFLAGDPLIAFDYDGTLAPIGGDRDRVSMRPETRELLASVASRYPVAVISGRSRADLLPRLEGTGVRWAVGNHGIEQNAGSSVHEEAVAAWAAALETEIGAISGAELENKRLSLSLHYRNSADPAQAANRIRHAVSRLGEHARITDGKMVINIVPAGAPNKHDALRSVMLQARRSTALFSGDDTTDEDVFLGADRHSVFTVKVGSADVSHARFYLHDQLEIDALLARIADARLHETPGAEAADARR